MVDGYLPDTLLPDPPVTLVTEVAVLLPGSPASIPERAWGGLYSRECMVAGDSLRIREVVDLSPSEGPALAREDVVEAASMCREPAGRTVVIR